MTIPAPKTQPSSRRCFIISARMTRRPQIHPPRNRNRVGSAKRGSTRWTEASEPAMKYDMLINGARRSVEITPPLKEGSRMAAVIDGRSIVADAAKILPGVYSILLRGRSLEVIVEETDGWPVVAHCRTRVSRGNCRPPRLAARAWRKHRARRPATGRRADARENRARPGRAGTASRGRPGLACHRSDENAERNSFAQIRHGRRAGPGRPNGKRRGNPRGCHVEPRG